MARTENNLRQGREVAAIRERLGLDRPAMARALDLTEKTLTQVENGWQGLGSRSRARLAKIEAGGYIEPQQERSQEVADKPEAYCPRNGLVAQIAEIVASPDVRSAVDAMVTTGMRAATAWRAIINAKLEEKESNHAHHCLPKVQS
jgi:DNA-binding XRE family transcriptional regulator